MIDTQGKRDNRNKAIKKVGIAGIKYPITVLDKVNGTQGVNAAFNLFVDLSEHFKGTHMSRFVAILNEHRGQISTRTLRAVLKEIKERLGASRSFIEVEFPYFIEKEAPVSREKSLMEYTCFLKGEYSEEKADFIAGVTVPVATYCPCSKELCGVGAHNQRTMVTVSVRYQRFFWMEDLISLVEGCASAPIYSLLKRPDEKFVTEQGFANPFFVEDVVRNVALKLDEEPNFIWYSVEAKSMESIHNHNAFAYIEA
ncbi:MAG: GTP cyclohydrolase FolE2 [Deltaproteobacteria bacterium]|nr:GTP cyclohydrolase FolE2 [Deltaproteobacteria bacterium]